MANEPDSLVLVHLREIRATLAQHSAHFDRIDERFARIDHRFNQIDDRFAQMAAYMGERFSQVDERFIQMDKRFDDLRDVLGHTFALSTTNNLKSRQHDQLHQLSEGEQQRLRERVDEIERRITKVEGERGH